MAILTVAGGLWGPPTAHGQTPDWLSRISPYAPGPVPMIQPFRASMRFGWSGFEAARAEAVMTSRGGRVEIRVTGGTTGVVRGLWKLDARHRCTFFEQGLRPDYFHQEETYSNRKITTEAVFQKDGLWRKRETVPGTGAKWKKIRIEPIRDIISAMFYVRSQPLTPRTELSFLAFPGDSPFLVRVRVVGRETLTWKGTRRPAIKLELQLQRILLEKDEAPRLQAHGKFRKGTVWLTDDRERFPLRAEVDVFIGSVFAELESVTFSGGR